MDLFSTIIRLRARQNATGLGYLGRQMQAWFLREVSRYDSEVSARLHDESPEKAGDKAMRPYTLSTLYKGPYPPRELHAGEWCWVRLTLLTRELSEWVIGKVLPELLPVAHIGQAEFDIEPWRAEQQQEPWAISNTYAGLLRQIMNSDNRRMELDFSSPTSFKEKVRASSVEKDIPLPLPDRVFGSYLSHWSAYSGENLGPEIGEFIEECLVVNEFKIRSERVQFSQKVTQRATTGFVGQACFSMVGSKQTSRFGSNWEHYANVMRMLALYSFYCGTGHRTTIGLGQTRPVSIA